MTTRLFHRVAATLAVVAVAAVGCSNDVSADDPDCPPGYTYHPVDQTCLLEDGGDQPDADTEPRDTDADAEAADTDAGCQGLDCAEDVSCDPGEPSTSVSGTVAIPSGQLPLPDVHVYVPADDSLDPVQTGASCERCEDQLTGEPVVATTTRIDGSFRLADVPVVDDLPVVVEIGKWRRTLTVPDLQPCTDNPVDPDDTRLPANLDEGQLPRVAMTTGGCDAMECLMRKIGVDDQEFTTDDADGAVHLLAGQGGTDRFEDGPALSDATEWWNDADNLLDYDLLVHSCECGPHRDDKSDQARQALRQFTHAGGRAFLSHYHYAWLEEGPFAPVADWDPLPLGELLGTATGRVDASFPKGERFEEWMGHTGTTPSDQFTIHEPRGTIDEIFPSYAQRWIYLDETEADSDTDDRPQYFSFNTPIDADEDHQCGRVVFSDIHVAADQESSPDHPFPSGCTDEQLTDQEKALVFMLFDLSRCIISDDKKPTQ